MRVNYRAIPFEHCVRNSTDASTFYTLYNVSLNVDFLSFVFVTWRDHNRRIILFPLLKSKML